MWWSFLLFSKGSQLYVYTHSLFSTFFFHLGYHGILSRVPCALHWNSNVLDGHMTLNPPHLPQQAFTFFSERAAANWVVHLWTMWVLEMSCFPHIWQTCFSASADSNTATEFLQNPVPGRNDRHLCSFACLVLYLEDGPHSYLQRIRLRRWRDPHPHEGQWDTDALKKGAAWPSVPSFPPKATCPSSHLSNSGFLGSDKPEVHSSSSTY